MKEFEKIKKDFREDIEKSINDNYDILLESFIEYYGEEYRDVITKHYKNISYVFYIPIVFLEELDEENKHEVIDKTGLSIGLEIERNNEELLNDKAAEEITQIFRQKGGDISAFCFDDIGKYEYAYKANYYLIDEFYDTFKDYIKIARITEKKNILIERIGKENYQNFCNLINEYYSDVEIVNKEEKINNISSLIKKMKENTDNQNDMTNDDLLDYYKKLRDNGHNVRILNDLDTMDYTKKKGKTR